MANILGILVLLYNLNVFLELPVFFWRLLNKIAPVHDKRIFDRHSLSQLAQLFFYGLIRIVRIVEANVVNVEIEHSLFFFTFLNFLEYGEHSKHPLLQLKLPDNAVISLAV